MPSPYELIAQLTLAIDHKSTTPPFAIIPGTASPSDQRFLPSTIDSLRRADAWNEAANDAVATAHNSGPTIAAAHAAWAAKVASTRANSERATRAAAAAPSNFADAAARDANAAYHSLMGTEPPSDTASAVAAARARQVAAQASLDAQVAGAIACLAYLAVP